MVPVVSKSKSVAKLNKHLYIHIYIHTYKHTYIDVK